MNLSPSRFLVLVFTTALALGLGGREATGQTLPGLRPGPVRDAFASQGTAIDEQRVSRQVEIARLDRIMDRFESRLIRLERQLRGSARTPMITIAEAEAALAFAQAQLRASENPEGGEQPSELRLASDRLAVARAQGQLDAARVAHSDSLVVLELDVLQAERELLLQNQEKKTLERMVAKGYTSSDALRLRLIDVNLAEKQVELAKLRLAAQKRAAASSKAEPTDE